MLIPLCVLHLAVLVLIVTAIAGESHLQQAAD